MTRPKLIALAALLLLQAGDLISTRLALAVPGVVELNPVVRDLGLYPAKLITCGFCIMLVLYEKKLWRTWCVCALFAAIVGSNLLLVWRHRF